MQLRDPSLRKKTNVENYDKNGSNHENEINEVIL
jgi:hypothetical protein